MHNSFILAVSEGAHSSIHTGLGAQGARNFSDTGGRKPRPVYRRRFGKAPQSGTHSSHKLSETVLDPPNAERQAGKSLSLMNEHSFKNILF